METSALKSESPAKPRTTMSTVDKALALLRHFSLESKELGLSELARMAGHDKTTTLRCLTALERNGFVEQDAVSRKYRLGLAPINLARIREHSFPVQSVLSRYTDMLARDLGETTHATLLLGETLVTATISEPERALRVALDPSEILPMHATASGLAVAAHLPKDQRATLLARKDLRAYTPQTPTQGAGVAALLKDCQTTGLARADGTYEADVTGTAAAFFGASGQPVGAVAVAAVAHRLTPDLQSRIDTGLRQAARDITRDLGGVFPSSERTSS